MKIVVDSNIVFSSILNVKSHIGQILINGSKYFQFYSIGLLTSEIIKHKDKLQKISGYDDLQFFEIYYLIISKIKFFDDIFLTDEEIDTAYKLVKDVDEDDTLFVALNKHLSAKLWTGDKQLIKGLRKKNYYQIITTDELYQIYLDKELNLE